jgi:hypothetical protein
MSHHGSYRVGSAGTYSDCSEQWVYVCCILAYPVTVDIIIYF